jgi:hypothetical protein
MAHTYITIDDKRELACDDDCRDCDHEFSRFSRETILRKAIAFMLGECQDNECSIYTSAKSDFSEPCYSCAVGLKALRETR